MVIPKKYYSSLLKLLHKGHPEITSMKSLFRRHVCWPNINADIGQTVQSRSNCQETVRDPVRAPLHQFYFQDVLGNIYPHIDYASPYISTVWLLLTDV